LLTEIVLGPCLLGFHPTLEELMGVLPRHWQSHQPRPGFFLSSSSPKSMRNIPWPHGQPTQPIRT
jgi:hypothetical protein